MKPLLLNVTNQAKLTEVLNIKEDQLELATSNTKSLYRKIKIQKMDGTDRIINAPNDLLKTIQRSILDKILISSPLSKCAYGFGKGKSIIDNARTHSKNSYMLNADIKDFFPSVHFSRIHKLFVSMGGNRPVANILTRLTTLNHSLPQGAPTSPYLASLALNNLDHRLMDLCAENRLTYTRYFDDITISGGERAHKILDTVENIMNKHGYEMHKGPDKLRLSGPADEKLVTGIRIKGGKLSVPDSDSVLEYILLLQRKGMSGLKDDNLLKEQESLKGKINFIRQVDTKLGLKLETEFSKVSW